MARKSETIPVTESSGNVFTDLGVREPEEELAKALLASHIRRAIKGQRLTQAAAARITRTDQPKISALMAGRLTGFSSDRLLRLLTALGQDVDIVVRAVPRPGSPGHIRVVAAA